MPGLMTFSQMVMDDIVNRLGGLGAVLDDTEGGFADIAGEAAKANPDVGVSLFIQAADVGAMVTKRDKAYKDLSSHMDELAIEEIKVSFVRGEDMLIHD